MLVGYHGIKRVFMNKKHPNSPRGGCVCRRTAQAHVYACETNKEVVR